MRRAANGTGVTGLVCLALMAAGVLAAAQPQEVSAPSGWIELPAAGATSANAFVDVSNPTMYDVYLVSATTDVAETVEFRRDADETVKELTVPAYGSLPMSGDGVHLVLTGLKRPLEAGERVSISLKTDGGVTMDVAAEVRRE